MTNEEERIELRSEEFQDILGTVPHWILRRGITILALIVLVFIIGSAVFKYPDVITAEVTLTGLTPPANIVAKASGKLDELLVSDNQVVTRGQYLAIIENPVNTEDISYLKNFLDSLIVSNETKIKLPRKQLKLGGIQSLYSGLYGSLYDFEEFKRLKYYPAKIETTKIRIAQYQNQYINMMRQGKIGEQQLALSRKQFVRDSTLYKNRVYSPSEFEGSQNKYLQACLSYENICTLVDNMQMQITQMEETLSDIEQQYTEKKSSFTTQLNNSINQLRAETQNWEMNYVLTSPIEGKISFTKFWAQNQNINAGEEVFTVIPTVATRLIGKAALPLARSGKVKTGQKVNIKFDNFSDAEFGMVLGVVKNISLVPIQVGNNYSYTLELEFPHGLTTTYNKTLPFFPQMKGQADIITNDLSLLERFFMPLRKIWENGFTQK